MNKIERQEYVERRSRELAQSGEFDGYQAIEHHLVFNEGYLEARGWLDSPSKRTYLDMLCQQARAGGADA